jgi:YjjG family noncanonical pyrimidine nucleotidase
MKYKHLFFDLDHTLWDFEKNSSESLEDIYYSSDLNQYGISSLELFIESFLRINTALWDAFDKGNLHHSYIRQNRFKMVFEELGVTCPENHEEISEIYLQTLPGKKNLLEGALEVLEYVASKGYDVHIITNGFNDIQSKKILSSGIDHFFQNVITFENASAKKPDPQIFAYALEKANALPENSIMIGDNWIADVMGAKQSGIDQVYLNPAGLQFEETPTYDIRRLEELKLIL